MRYLLVVISGLLFATYAYAIPDISDFQARETALDTESGSGEYILLNQAIGTDIDPNERSRYHLLPGISGFEGARITRIANGTARLEYRYLYRGAPRQAGINLSASALRLTRLHVWLCDLFLAELKTGEPMDGAMALRYTALRFASLARYAPAIEILEDLSAHYADTEAAAWAEAILPEFRAIHLDHRTLIWDQSAGLGSGSNDLRLFGSYYGLWLGFAIPLALQADSPEPYGLGLILGGPVGYIVADRIARRTPISEGNATILSLGGNFGTWQGLGWAAHNHADGHEMVTSGIFSGLAGLGVATLISSNYEFSEGHAAMTESAMNWGAWYGMVVAGMSGDYDHPFRRNALIGSAVGVGVVGLTAKGVDLSEKQVRLISLKGLLGTVMGFGALLIAQPDDDFAAWGIVGMSGATGLYLGARSAFHDTPAETAARRVEWPQLTAYRDPGGRPGLRPALVYRFGF